MSRVGARGRIALALLVVALAGYGLFRWSSTPGSTVAAPATNDPVERGCDLGPKLLRRIWRGHHPAHSEDLTTVPRRPNCPGAFTVLGHSGPWDYLQRVPLVLYGPGEIQASSDPIERPVSITDVYPTMGRLTGVDVRRAGHPLAEALGGGAGPPKLILTVVWDGAGSNVLARWPDAHPTLDRLEREGTSYANATVGSSPSITPSVHSSLGTGLFPREHGITGIQYRADDGHMTTAFAGGDPRALGPTTYADEIDQGFDNRSKVGMVAWKVWHLGMLGHGAAIPGGDHDELALLHKSEHATGNRSFYSTPAYLREGVPGLDRRLREVDLSDGEADDEWKGSDILEHDNPAWVEYQTDVVLEMMKREAYGRNAIPDLVFLNYKMSDIVGHKYSMDSPRMAELVRAQDEALKRLVSYLEDEVGDFVVLVTADHGHTPDPATTGGWPVQIGELARDVDAHFEVGGEGSLIEQTSPVGLFLDREAMAARGVRERDIARFLNDYTLQDNWGSSELPSGYEDRAEERILSAAFGGRELPDIMRCATRDPG